MELRKHERVPVSEKLFRRPDDERLFFEFDSGSIPARIVDINQDGIGFEVYSPHLLVIDDIARAGESFISLNLGETRIIAGITVAWHRQERGENGGVCRGGLRINMISPEDRLKLYERIESIRRSRETMGTEG